MTQVSRFPIHKDVYYEIRDDFLWILSALHSEEEVKSFYYDFFTKTERLMLSKRLAVAIMLTENFSYRDIRFILHVSTSTVSRVADWLDHGGEGVRHAIHKLTKREQMKTFLEKADKFLEKNIFNPHKYPFD